MVSFDFTEDQLALRDTVRRFASKTLAPGYNKRSASHEFFWDEYRQMAEMGLLSIGLPTEFGGTGEDDFVSLGIACEEIGYGDVNCASVPVTTGLIAAQLALAGSSEVQQKWIPRLVSGETVVGLGLTEPDAGSDAGALRMVAEPVAGGYQLTGEKNSVSLLAASSAVIVYARIPGQRGMLGISAFLVELNQKGVSTGFYEDMGSRPMSRGTLNLDHVFVPTADRIGEEGRGMALAGGHFGYSRAGIALMCLGAARASLDETSAYAKTRMSFGKPLAARQGVSLQLAEHYTYLEACRLMCYHTLALRQQKKAHVTEAAMCKWWGPRVAVDAIQSAMVFHGHVGYTNEAPLQARFRDVMGFLWGDGTAEIQKLMIARSYIGDEVLDR
jgi:cyclohexanecarboxyl-CoA dehydrogenase